MNGYYRPCPPLRRVSKDTTTKHYVVFMGEHLHPNSEAVINANHDILASIIGSFCANGTLDPALIQGKTVVCTIEIVLDSRTDKSVVAKEAGGVGMVLIDPVASDVGFEFVIPATSIGAEDAEELQAYLATQK
ncbi:hypothetical protein ACLOJK_040796 [Asimina triloba]